MPTFCAVKCEADPGALAKYVVALVKKEKPIAELRESCVDQLDVFLQTKTKPFVDTLFEVLDKKSYFTEEDLKPAPARVEPDSQTILPSEAGGEPVPAETLIIPERKPSTEIAVTVAENKDDPPIITSNVPSNEPRRRRSRSRSPRLYRGRDGDDRRRRYDDRERRPYDRGPPRRKSNSPIPIKQRLGPRPRSRSPNRRRSPYRPLNRSRSPRARPRGRPFSRSRSKTRSPRRSWSRSRSRERLRSRSPYSGKSRSPRRQVIRPRSPRPGSPGRMSRSPRPRSKSPIYRSRSPGRRSRSPVRRISRSPGRMSRSPIRRLSRSPARRVSPVRGSPIRRSSKSPLRTSRSRSPIRRSRSPGRRLSRSPIRRSGSPIRRSGSPGRRLSRSPLRRSLSPDSRSRSPTRFSRSRSGTRSRSDSPRRKVLRRDSDSRGPTPTQEDGLGGSPTPTLSSIAVVTGSYREGEPRSEPRPDSRLRCRDFDEKGFCVRGDLCVYDHGADPVIVENLPQYPPQGPPGPRLPQVSGPPPGFPVGLPPPGFMGRMPGPPPHLLRPPRPEFQEYNPEAPGINIRPRGPPPGFWPGAPRGPPPLGFLCGPPPQAPTAQLPRTRDLVNLTTVKREPEVEPEADDDEEVPTSSSRTVIIPKEELPAPVPQPPPPGTLPEVTTALAAPAAPTYTQPQHQFLHQQRYHPYQRFPGPRKPFDYGRVGGYRRPDMTNCTLEVNKIPRDMNNIAKLNEHFGTFGTLKNIEVSYEGDPEAALITYRTNFEALKCYKSSEPVFNNRFIKLFWHKKADTNGSQEQAPSSTTTPGVPNPSQQPDPDSSRQPAEARLGPVPPTIPPASKLSLNNVTKSTPSTHPTSADKGVVYTTSMGTISKTVYNPVAQKPKTQIADNMISPTAVMAAGFISRIEAVKKHEAVKQEAIQKSLEIRKNKQHLLEKQIGQQKLLIARLEKNKTMKEEEKSVIMTALKSLTENIEKLKSELGGRKVVLKKQKSVEVKSPEQAKKEILDVELELMTKSTSGEDTADLKLKLSELTKVANSMGLLGRGRGRGAVVQGTATTWVASGVARPTLVVGRGRGRGALTGRAAVASRTLDRRPRTVEVTGFTAEEKEEIALHLAKMREVEKMEFNMSVPSAILTFKTRHDGEMGILYGSKFKTKTLKMTWHVPKPTFTRSSSSLSGDTEDADTESNVDEIDEEALLAGEDEDEEGEGERSWKH